MRRTRIGSSLSIVALAVSTSMVIVACSGDGAEVSQLEAALADAAAENALLAEDFAATQQELNEARIDIADCQDNAASAAAELEAVRGEVAALKTEVGDLESAIGSAEAEGEEAVRAAEEALKKSEDQVQALMLAYDADISAASSDVSRVAQEFACEYGKAALEAGKSEASISSTAILSAFLSSERYSSLIAESESVATLFDFVSDAEDALNAPADEILKAPAAACWQAADAKVNAALYEHQSVLTNAVLDSACTNGTSAIYDRWNGYTNTAAYQSWELTVGDEYAREYIAAVEERYGSLEAFLAIPPEDLGAEAARCRDVKDLISPKSSHTWNVGEEIKPGTWKAFDVSDCYWARLAENGDIRANHFGDGLRLSVDVSPSDGQFEISGCTFYYANP